MLLSYCTRILLNNQPIRASSSFRLSMMVNLLKNIYTWLCITAGILVFYYIKKGNQNTSGTAGGASADTPLWKRANSIYEFEATDIDGNSVSMEKYRGKVCVIVNVACKCGFTNDNYKQLQALHERYKDQGLSILGFPCNQFAGQEPWPESEIKDFLKQYNVAFDMFSKIEVNGDNAHPLFKFLKTKLGGALGIDFIKWNFTKFLVDRNGQPVQRYAPTTPPNDFENDIVNQLKTNAKI